MNDIDTNLGTDDQKASPDGDLGQTQIATLGDVAGSGGSVVRKYVVLTGENLGSMTLKMCLPIKEFVDISQVGNRSTVEENEAFSGEFVAQRPLIAAHARGLARYTLVGLIHSQITDLQQKGESVSAEVIKIRDGIGKTPYTSLQPIVANIRDCKFGGNDIQFELLAGAGTGVGIVTLSSKQTLWVVDGQHRREGFNMVLAYLDTIRRTYKYPKKGLFVPADGGERLLNEIEQDFWTAIFDRAVQRCTVSVEVHVGLDRIQEQQLFHDLNNLGKKVSASLAYSYDHTDPVNMFIKDQLVDEGLIGFEMADKDQKDWHQDDGSMLRKDLVQVNAFLFLGKTNTKSSTPELIKSRESLAIKFWKVVQSIDAFGEPGAKTQTVAAQPVVLKALAKLTNELAFGHASIRSHDSLTKVFDAIINKEISFDHSEPIWRLLFLDTAERNSTNQGIDKYVHVPQNTNLDAGTFDPDNQWVRFGSRHNDIIPRLGDIIRWKLGLNPRPSVIRSIEKEKAQTTDEASEAA